MPFNVEASNAIRAFVEGHPAYAGKSPAECAVLFNTRKSQSPPVYRDVPISKEKFLLTVAPYIAVLAGKSAELKDKWDRIVGVLAASASIHVNDAIVQGMLAAAVADGIIPQAVAGALAALGKEEVLVSDASLAGFGDNVVTIQDMEAALA